MTASSDGRDEPGPVADGVARASPVPAADLPPRPWSLADGASLIFLDMGLLGLAGWLSEAVGATLPFHLTASLARLLVFLPVALLVIVKLWGARLRDVGIVLPAGGSFRWLLGFTAAVLGFYAVLGLACLVWLRGAADAALIHRLGAQARMFLGAGASPAALALASLVAAPLAEELVFRGVLYPALRARLAAAWAVLVSAALFALMHLVWSWTLFLPWTQFLGGIIFAVLYERTRSILWPVVFHVSGNLFILANAWAWGRHSDWIAVLLGLPQ
jgi:membrane protease YdiL (CAAX protease family)